jgi:hypothetical protein
MSLSQARRTLGEGDVGSRGEVFVDDFGVLDDFSLFVVELFELVADGEEVLEEGVVGLEGGGEGPVLVLEDGLVLVEDDL